MKKKIKIMISDIHTARNFLAKMKSLIIAFYHKYAILKIKSVSFDR